MNELHKFWETENVRCDRRIATEDEFESEVKSLYCDDFISSFDSEEETIAQNSKLKECFNDTGLNLRKWKSNVQDLTEKIAIMENKIVLDAIKENFEKTISDLKSCESIELNRHYFSIRKPQELIDSVELHEFSDASMKAYGLCVYIVYWLKTGDVIHQLDLSAL